MGISICGQLRSVRLHLHGVGPLPGYLRNDGNARFVTGAFVLYSSYGSGLAVNAIGKGWASRVEDPAGYSE